MLSAYRDKFEKYNKYYHEKYGKTIVSRYFKMKGSYPFFSFCNTVIVRYRDRGKKRLGVEFYRNVSLIRFLDSGAISDRSH